MRERVQNVLNRKAVVSQKILEELIITANLLPDHAAAFRKLFAQVSLALEMPSEVKVTGKPTSLRQTESITATFTMSAEPGSDEEKAFAREVTEENQQLARDVEDKGGNPIGELGRYSDLGVLAKGGMGIVCRVRDERLHRSLAMKILNKNLLDRAEERMRFVEEAQIGAQLQHPNIVPVHEIGELPDGRPYFTMREAPGRRFSEVIREHHAGAENSWNLRRLIDATLKICEAIAFAHDKGVIHRDLKPSNVMVGQFGEVLVVDWGIAKLLSRIETPTKGTRIRTQRTEGGGHTTLFGHITGTPGYMSPEQAMGDIDVVDTRSDVYALGAILYELLSGHPPYRRDTPKDTIQALLDGPPTPLSEIQVSRPEGSPIELIQICEKAMVRDPEQRYPHARYLARAIRRWLDGTERRAQALEIVNKALRRDQEIEKLHQKAAQYRAEGQLLLQDIPKWEHEDRKSDGWSKEDAATLLEQRTEMLMVEKEQLLQGALTHKPDLPEAHAALAREYQALHIRAEAERNRGHTIQAELRLRQHASSLKIDHDERRNFFEYIKGDGSLTLHTEPQGASVKLERYILRNRRLVPEAIQSLGQTPLSDVPLKMGSYRLRIQHKGYHEVLCPIAISRGLHWDGVPPGGTESEPIRLLKESSYSSNDLYIPAGWFWCGDMRRRNHSLPRTRLWLPGFIIRTHPVTVAEYVEFLNGLLEEGREEDAVKWAPQDRVGRGAAVVHSFLHRGKDGRFVLDPSEFENEWSVDFPVRLIPPEAMWGYCAWYAEKTNFPWRLPTAIEWEKAARGVDGRFFPWGDRLDPSWCCMQDSHLERPHPHKVTAFPVDESPYGVRGLAGNIADVCASLVSPGGVDQTPMLLPPSADEGCSVKGGRWFGDPDLLRMSGCTTIAGGVRNLGIGFRLARSL